MVTSRKIGPINPRPKPKPRFRHLDRSIIDDIKKELLKFDLTIDDFEFIEIDLSGWTKKKPRELSIKAGFEDYYKLVYDPASADVHGTWTSLKKTNLSHCQIALHRFHKMPTLVEPPLFIQNVNLAQEIYERCLNIGQKHLNFSKFEKPLQNIWQVVKTSKSQS